jgi:thymidylate synthase (FAD)
MQVKLIARTEGIGDLAGMTVGQILAYVARVSNPTNQLNNETAEKLLGYCLRNQHWSVFESASLTLEVKTSRAIAQQILRHRSFTFQEFSQRYAEVTSRGPGENFEYYPARRQDDKNRQNSIDDLSEADKAWFHEMQVLNNEAATQLYHAALGRGIAKEQARFLLPSSAATTLYMTGNIRSWLTYCQLRCAPATQLEHREIDLACKDFLGAACPDLEASFPRVAVCH